LNLRSYRIIIFDCDGVILNSNPVKSDAFYKIALPYGIENAKAFVKYHRLHGGISRYEKIEYFFNNIIRKKPALKEKEKLLELFSEEVKHGLMKCEVADGLKELRKETVNSKWMVVSGSDESELRKIFIDRKLDFYFDGGIFGSPTTKNEILARELKSGKIKYGVLFLGDSLHDYKAALKANMDFIFIYNWSEFENGVHYFTEKRVPIVPSIGHLKFLR
jgi:HAD superfamily hydrolase (TIGR01549 family)